MSTLATWIGLAREKGASDVHLEPGSPLVLRIRGELTPVGEPVPGETLTRVAKELLGGARWTEFLAQRSADLSQTVSGARCRIHAYQTLRGVSLAVRVLSTFRNTVRDCNLHPELARCTEKDTGLVLVAGPTGSGKSTTLAAFVEEVNATRRRHIVTIESPVEYYFRNRKSFIRQREVSHHTPSFEQAIVDAMREDPDVLVIGEMRTPEVMRLTLNAAETGHLVFSTIHSSSCAEALTRLCMSFPSDLQSAVCNQVADCLVAVICQRLTYYPRFNVRVPICEVLWANGNVKSVVRSGQFAKLSTAIQTGGEDGMWTFDRYRRWADERVDWVTKRDALPDDREESATPIPAPAAKAPPSMPAAQSSGNGAIEIQASDEDLDDIIQQMIKKGPGKAD